MPAICWNMKRKKPSITGLRYLGKSRSPQLTSDASLAPSASSAPLTSARLHAPQRRRPASRAFAVSPCLASHLGDSGMTRLKAPSKPAGTAAIQNMVRHHSAFPASGRPAMSAPRMPKQMESWLKEPSAPRTAAGATSEMYTGTTQLDSPMPTPQSKRPSTKTFVEVASAHIAAPANMGIEDITKDLQRPYWSLRLPPRSDPRVAPASVMLTIRPCTAVLPTMPSSTAM
mmetsp:Transcript_1355/g.2810  ORF Transcript_1355/g.2810 Transcript_1355/m.2810 type:complete len:229 (+) Transcript_1355:699-1385(+)